MQLSGITFIRYAQGQNSGKLNDFKIFWEQDNQHATSWKNSVSIYTFTTLPWHQEVLHAGNSTHKNVTDWNTI
jgi:hypothetical protein